MYEAVHRRLLEPELIQTATVPDPADAAQKKKESPFLLKPKSIENTKYDPIEKIREKMQEKRTGASTGESAGNETGASTGKSTG